MVKPNKYRVQYKLSLQLTSWTNLMFITSAEDKHSVAVKLLEQTVGHMPREYSRRALTV